MSTLESLQNSSVKSCLVNRRPKSNGEKLYQHIPLYNFLARDVIYTSRAYATMSVSSVCPSVGLSVTEVHWRIIANLGFKFRSKFTAHCGRNNMLRYASHC